MSDNDNATECPICLCPVTDEPWGVCAPCGHPFHRSCWDQVTANFINQGARRKKKNPPCAICKRATREFVPVFLDLSRPGDCGGGEGCTAAMESSGDHDRVIVVDGGDGTDLEELAEALWRQLNSLCKSEDHNKDGEQCSVIDVTGGSDRYVEDICAMVDLTQHQSASPQSSSLNQQPHATSIEAEIQRFQQKQGRIQETLKQLSSVHNKILNSGQEKRPTPNSTKIQHLKSKVMDLQTTNSSLASEKKSLQNASASLTNNIEQLQQTILDRSLECERIKSKYSALKTQFRSIEESYKKYTHQSTLTQASLKEKNALLQKEMHKLSNQASLDQVHEMDEVRRNYTTMSQEVHDVRAKNARLQEKIKSRERAWEVRHERERDKCKGLRNRLEKMLEGNFGSENAYASGAALAREVGCGQGVKGSPGVGKESSTTGPSANLEDNGNEKNGGGHTTESASFGIYQQTSALVRPRQQAGSFAMTSHIGHCKQREKSSIAMEVLDRAPSRKFSTAQGLKPPHHPKQKYPNPRQPSSHVPLTNKPSGSHVNNLPTEGVRLMMRTNPRSSQKRRHGGLNINAQNDEENVRENHSKKVCGQSGNQPRMGKSIASTPTRNANRTTAEIKQKGNITTFFKPVVDVDV